MSVIPPHGRAILISTAHFGVPPVSPHTNSCQTSQANLVGVHHPKPFTSSNRWKWCFHRSQDLSEQQFRGSLICVGHTARTDIQTCLMGSEGPGSESPLGCISVTKTHVSFFPHWPLFSLPPNPTDPPLSATASGMFYSPTIAFILDRCPQLSFCPWHTLFLSELEGLGPGPIPNNFSSCR